VLLNASANVDARNSDSDTPLLLAARLGGAPWPGFGEFGPWPGHTAVALALLAAGADPDARSSNQVTPGSTALIVAAGKGVESLGLALIAAGADINAKNNNGDTALLLATMERFPALVLALVEGGADVAVKDKSGWTLLHFSANQGEKAVTQVPHTLKPLSLNFEACTRNPKP
jgi:ankyrin repeat protein